MHGPSGVHSPESTKRLSVVTTELVEDSVYEPVPVLIVEWIRRSCSVVSDTRGSSIRLY